MPRQPTPGQAAIVAAARGCVGARFRLQGRSVATGLDCVGVVALAYGCASVPGGYALRGADLAGVIAAIEAAGFVRIDAPYPAALLLLAPGPYQHHLAILTDRGFVHADAGLRRVVEVPGLPRWPPVGIWRVERGSPA
jgi:murein DD-endopeptidase / murein LD-carboxypeptidase